MADTAISTSNYRVMKNRKFWIADLLKLYNEQEQFDNETKTYSKTNAASNIISRIKTLSVVGVVVGLRNEKHEKLDMRSTDGYESNRPVVYGKHISIVIINFNIGIYFTSFSSILDDYK